MVSNLEIAWALEEIADLLEIKGDNPFKIRAYRQGARVLQNFTRPVAGVSPEELQEIKGIGKALAQKVVEMASTGHLAYLDRLRREVPLGLREMLAIPGLGPKSVRLIYDRLGISNLDDLIKAAEEKRIRELPGLGSKTELNIRRGVELLRENTGRVPLGLAWPLADELLTATLALPGVGEASIAGEIRRGAEMVHRVEIVVAAGNFQEVLEVLARHPRMVDVSFIGAGHLEASGPFGLELAVSAVPPPAFGWALLYHTGAAGHYRRLIKRQEELGLDVLNFTGPAPGSPMSEEEIYRALGLPFIPPELREDQGEIEAALAGRLPRLVEAGEIKGEFHVHTKYSDGLDSLQVMARAARERGYQYLGVADHSRSLAVAKGLAIEKLQQQGDEVKCLAGEMADFFLLHGTEVDILADGSLDYPEEVLAGLDVVIASIHTGFKQSREQIAQRLERVLRNPYVDILGHPSGRILGRRPPYELDAERLLELAAETGTVLEINASGDRLDLGSEQVRRAVERGIALVINTDAHDAAHLADMRYGLATARRGWATAADVLNTRSWPEVKEMLAAGRERRRKLV